MKKIFYSLGLTILGLILVAPLSAQEAETLPETSRLDIERLTHLYQNWNNCGPATMTMALGYYGYPSDTRAAQEAAAAYMKPSGEDRNVSPWQMADYVNRAIGADYGLEALVRRGGDLETIKRLLAADLPVIIERALDPPDQDNEWIGHYSFLIGYDEAEGVFLAYDAYMGHGNLQGLRWDYDFVSDVWWPFNNIFILLYPAERAAELPDLLGDLWDERAAWEVAQGHAAQAAAANPADVWGWFNLGEASAALGQYEIAAQAYQAAFDTSRLPWRTLWYLHGAFDTYFHLGNYDALAEIIASVERNISGYARQLRDQMLEELNYYRGLIAAAQGESEAAIGYFERVLSNNENFHPAAEVLAEVQAGTFDPATFDRTLLSP